MIFLKKIYHFVVDSKILSLSGALCFFLLLNGGSFLFLFVSMSNYLKNFLPVIELNIQEGELKDLLIYLVNHNNNLTNSIFLLLTSLYSSSSLYYHYLNICEFITKEKNKYRLNKRLISLILVPVFLIILYVMLGLVYYIYFYLSKLLFVIAFMFVIILFIYILNVIGLKNHRIKDIYKGCIFTIIYTFIFTILFILFVGIFSEFKIVYGSLSILIIGMFYLYAIVIGILFGININCKKIDVFNYFFAQK